MKKLLLLLVAAFAMSSATAQMQTPLPVDSAVRTGKLENGMTYYIRHNEKPKGQADFYIWHDVGAIQEEDNQQGLAHFLEHMAFNGTKNLPGKKLTEYLETVGVKFGYNLNAYTTWDQTCYNISDVPTSRQGIIDTALLILHDWSHFIALEPKEIDSERGVIMEELRTRENANSRATIKMIQAIGKDTPYEHRNLIGYLDDLKTFQHDALEGFYQKWYRPDYQAVVIVGDVDVDAVEKQLIDLMKDIPAPGADAAKKAVIVVPDNKEPIVSIYTDPEMQNTQASLYIKREALPRELNNTVYAQVVDKIHSYLGLMANARLQELSLKPDAPFLQAGMGSGSIGIIPTLNATIFTVIAKEGKLNEGFKAVYTEMERMRRHGFTYGEYERAQNDLYRWAEESYANRNDRTNASYVQDYLASYQKNTAIPSAEQQWQIDSALIKQLDLNTINSYLKESITDDNQVFVINAPEKEGLETPNEETLMAIRKEVMASEIEAYVDTVVKEPLISEDTKLEGSPVQTTTEDQLMGSTEWILKNGAKIILKQTNFKADELRMEAYAEGGLSLLSNEEYHTGELMSFVNSMSGVGKFSATDLKKQLSGISADMLPVSEEYYSGMRGSCSPKDVESMMQLLYLYFTQPRFNENDFNTMKTLLNQQLANVKTNPDYQMQEMITKVLYNNSPRREELTTEILDKVQFEQLAPVFKKLFPGVNGFTFVFVGNIDAETLRPLVEKYIGSLPSMEEEMNWVDDGVRQVEGVVKKEFRVPMQQPKVTVYYDFSGNVKYTLKEKAALSFLTQALNARYLVSIREEKGGTYGVGVGATTDLLPVKSYSMVIKFDTNEEMADELMEIIMEEIKTIAKNGPLSEDIEKHREFMLKNWQNSLEQNGSWMNFLVAKGKNGLNYLAEYEQTLRQLTCKDVQNMAKKILKDNNMVHIVMRPAPAQEK